MSRITENTLIPISILGVIAGGIFWLSTIYAQGMQNAKDIDSLTSELKEISIEIKSHNQQVIDRLARIEENIKRRK